MSEDTSADNTSKTQRQWTLGRAILEYLGSMNLAISLLVALAIASAIGTILQQNQPYNDYIIKFGPYWFEVFKTFDLLNVYSATWFLSLLGFLLLSTSICVYRHTPSMLREMRSWRDNVQLSSLSRFKHQHQWSLQAATSTDETAKKATQLLKHKGYQTKIIEGESHTLLIGRKGRYNRMGYILTHLGIIVICLGGLLDSQLPFKVGEWMGKIKPETRDIVASQVPDVSTLSSSNPSYRGNVDIPEGKAAEIIFLQMRDGYLVQNLPFAIELKDFRVEHYPSGMPKSFESDLIIHDDQLDIPLEATISVNKPLTYRGSTIYQSNFGDGGSQLTFKAWPIAQLPATPVSLDATVKTRQPFRYLGEENSLEFTDFRVFNINSLEQEDGSIDQVNFGPNVTFRVRDKTGQAKEYVNYMAPVDRDGMPMFLSGMRASQAEDFRYLHIPADHNGSLTLFMALLQKLHDKEKMGLLSTQALGNAENNAIPTDVTQLLVAKFLSVGFDGIWEDIGNKFGKDRQEDVFVAYSRVLQVVISAAYSEVLEEHGITARTEKEIQWLEAAVTAISGIPRYGHPFYLQLVDFEHIQSSGLQITRSPGKNIVYLGSLMLTLGTFMLFYIHQRRFWLWLEKKDGQTNALFAASAQRKTREFEREFEVMSKGLEHRLQETEHDSNV